MAGDGQPAVEPALAGSQTTNPPRKGRMKSWLTHKDSWPARFARQDLHGFTPIISSRFVIVVYMLAGLVLLPIGIAALISSLNIQEHKIRYDNVALGSQSNGARAAALRTAGEAGMLVYVNFIPDKDMKPPIYVYYELMGYYQNYRRYVRSLDSKQLGGKNSTSSACSPQQFQGPAGQQSGLPNGGRINPCGLIAYSNFNDSFTATTAAGKSVPIDDSDIAWTYDRNHLYGSQLSQNYNDIPRLRGGNTTTVPLKDDQHFMVWMRPAAAANVRKLYGVINEKLVAGETVSIAVNNRYNTYDFNGGKYLIFSENAWIGGKNNFLGILFIALGVMSFVIAITFFFAYILGFVKHRKFGDLSDVSWNRAR